MSEDAKRVVFKKDGTVVIDGSTGYTWAKFMDSACYVGYRPRRTRLDVTICRVGRLMAEP